MRSLTAAAALSAIACTASIDDASTRAGDAGATPPASVPSPSAAPPSDAGPADGGGLDDGIGDGGAVDGGLVTTPPCPPEMVHLGIYCIDPYEAHLVVADGTEPRIAPFAEPPRKGVRYEARSAAGVTPQPYMSRNAAVAACKNAGKRLCTLGEWHRACRGPKRLRYPYGLHMELDRCNSGRPHLMREFFGDDPRLWKYDEHFNSPILSIAPGFLAKAGAFEGCTGPEGVFDMVGNLHEWVAGMVDQELVDGLAAEDIPRNRQPWQEGNGIFVGGFFSTRTELGPGCEYITIAHEPSYHDYSTGFRCCKTAVGDDAKKPKRR